MKNDEDYYRVIFRSKPYWIKNGHPTSAFFKSENGVSMDKKGQRTEDDVCDAFKLRFSKTLKGVVKLPDEAVKKAEAYVKQAASLKNPYHVELYNDKTEAPLTILKALILADASSVLFINDKPSWTCSK